mmetsp:Transcript_65418/g.151798  ORF Transcript_65418/g.151798 Transcript_65418/m.151798 type:complete len:200 (+) Transcript_65418:1132-1731(+)
MHPLVWTPWCVLTTMRFSVGASRATRMACWLKMAPWSGVCHTFLKSQEVKRLHHSGVNISGYVTRRSQSVNIHQPSVRPKVKSSGTVPPFCTSLKMMCPPGPRSVWHVANVDAKCIVAWITFVAKIWCISWLWKPWSPGCLSPLKMVNSTKGNCCANRPRALVRKACDKSENTYLVVWGLKCGRTKEVVPPVPEPISKM